MHREHSEEIFKSITSDNGSEFATLTEAVSTVAEVYFTHPYSSWERGTNENHNGMIRRFIPKGTRLSNVCSERIRDINIWMNKYPRKNPRILHTTSTIFTRKTNTYKDDLF